VGEDEGRREGEIRPGRREFEVGGGGRLFPKIVYKLNTVKGIHSIEWSVNYKSRALTVFPVLWSIQSFRIP